MVDGRKNNSAPLIYEDSFCDDIIDFFDVPPFEYKKDHNKEIIFTNSGKPLMIPNHLPTIEMFAHSKGVHRDSIYKWCKRYPEFKLAKERAQQLQYNCLIQNGLIGGYSAAFATFVAKASLGMREGDEADSEPAKPLTINYNVVDARVRDAES